MNIEELHKCAQDPVYFIETYVKIQHPIHGPVPFSLHPFQRDYINELHAGSVIAVFGRQMGKTALTAAYLLWVSIFKMEQRSMIISKTLPMANEVLSRIRFMFEELPGWLKPSVRYMNKQQIQFENGSKISVAAANRNAGRGQTLSNIVFEEFAYWPLVQQEEVFASIIPCLASTNARLIIPSTPKPMQPGEENLFNQVYENAVQGTNKMKALRYSWADHPERDEVWEQNMLAFMGRERFEAEFEAKVPA